MTEPTNTPDLDVIGKSYGWTLSSDGELLGLVAGDMGYEHTGITIPEDHLAAYCEHRPQPATASPVTVNPLVWVREEPYEIARTPFGFYCVDGDESFADVTGTIMKKTEYGSKAEAKSAAQADWNKRLSAIQPEAPSKVD